jgi:PAS domain S-box-containing protein
MPDRIRALYVDDEPGLLEVARIFLEQSPEICVETAESAKLALSSPAIASYDAIVSDYQMPDMDGIAFLKAVREKYGGIPFILFTGRGREEVVIDAINNGADFYLQKGGDPRAQFAELAHKIRQAVSRRKAQEELKTAYEQITASEEELREHYGEIAAAQQELQASREQMTEIADTVPGVVFQTCFRSGGRKEVTFISSRAPEVFGIRADKKDVLDQFFAGVDPRDRGPLDISIQEATLRGVPWEFEGRFIKPGGEMIWFQGLARPVRKPSGLYYNGVLLDITSRKKAEEAVLENAGKLKEAQEMAHLGFWNWDIATGNVEWSDEVFRIFGLDPGTFSPTIGSILARSPWSEEQERGRELVRKAMESHEPGVYEQRFLRPDNSIGYYYSTYQGRYDEKGNLTALVGTILDITGRKNVEEELRASEERLRVFIQHAPAALAMFDTEMRYLAASRRWIADYHLDARDIIGQSHYAIFPELPEALKAIHRRGLAGEVIASDEDRFVREDGSVQWLAWEVQPWYTNGNTIGGIIIYSDDITGRKEVEEKLRESEEKYRSLVDVSPVAVAVHRNGKVLYANPEAIRLLKAGTAGDLIGKDVLSFIHPDYRDKANSDFRFMNTDGQIIPLQEEILLTITGEPFTVEVVAKPIRYEGLHSVLVVFRDITERQLAEAALREAGQKLALLNSVTRHDIRNQLITLQGFTQYTLMNEKEPAIAGYLAKIDACATKIRGQIEFMKNYQELGASSPTWFRLEETVEKARIKELPCQNLCSGIEVFADPMLEKVFFNLFDNAYRHGEHATEIVVRCGIAEERLTIMVEDNGIGIPENEKEKIFEKGFGKNTGFGLFLAREILSITGITIRETGTPGNGGRFEIQVPKGKFRTTG